MKLRAILSRIDKYSKLWFVLIDDLYPEDTSRAKLARAGVALSGDEFGATMAQGIPPAELLGRRVIIQVRAKPYSFVSKLEHNKGQRVTGVKLLIEDIELA